MDSRCLSFPAALHLACLDDHFCVPAVRLVLQLVAAPTNRPVEDIDRLAQLRLRPQHLRRDRVLGLELLLGPFDLLQVSYHHEVIAVHCHLDVPLLVHEVAAGRPAPLEPDLNQEPGVGGCPVLRSVPGPVKAELQLPNQAFISVLPIFSRYVDEKGPRSRRVEVCSAHIEDPYPQGLGLPLTFSTIRHEQLQGLERRGG